MMARYVLQQICTIGKLHVVGLQRDFARALEHREIILLAVKNGGDDDNNGGEGDRGMGQYDKYSHS